MSHPITVIRDGRNEGEFPAEETESILEAAEAAGVCLPFGCRTGACGTCTARLVDGALDHRRPPRALKDRHLEAGFVLLCVAEPRASCRLIAGPDVVAELVSNPFKHRSR